MSTAEALLLGIILGGGAVMTVYFALDAYFDTFDREDT